MTDDKSREAFERVHLAGNKKLAARNEHGLYVNPCIEDAWAGFYTAMRYRDEQEKQV